MTKKEFVDAMFGFGNWLLGIAFIVFAVFDFKKHEFGEVVLDVIFAIVFFVLAHLNLRSE